MCLWARRGPLAALWGAARPPPVPAPTPPAARTKRTHQVARARPGAVAPTPQRLRRQKWAVGGGARGVSSPVRGLGPPTQQRGVSHPELSAFRLQIPPPPALGCTATSFAGPVRPNAPAPAMQRHANRIQGSARSMPAAASIEAAPASAAASSRARSAPLGRRRPGVCRCVALPPGVSRGSACTLARARVRSARAAPADLPVARGSDCANVYVWGGGRGRRGGLSPGRPCGEAGR
jgi:hypothetical protein